MKKLILLATICFAVLNSYGQLIGDTISIKGAVKHLLVQNYIDTIQSSVNKEKEYREYFYDEKGRLTESYNYNMFMGDSKQVHVYDDNGNLVRKTFFLKKDGEEVMDSVALEVYEYDDMNRMTQMLRYDKGKDGASYGYEYRYPADNKVISDYYMMSSLGNKEHKGTFLSIRDKNGQELEYHRYYDKAMKKEHPDYMKSTYNNKGQMIKIENIPTKKTEYWVEFKYNEQGDEIEKLSHSHKGESVSNTSYEYDKNNSWTVKHNGENAKKRKIGIVRFIEYYE